MRTDLQRLKRDSDSGRFRAVTSGALPAASGSTAHKTVPPQATVASKSRIALFASVTAVLLAALVAGAYYFRSQNAQHLTDKDSIVVADFANSTGDAVFDDTLKTALTVALNQSPFLNVLPDNCVAQTLKLMMRPRETKLTPEIARELCVRSGSKVYIAGSIASLGTQYVLSLKAVNCKSGDPLGEEQATASSKENVLNSLGKTAAKLRSQLGESLATVQKFDVPLEQATTSSLDAACWRVISDCGGHNSSQELRICRPRLRPHRHRINLPDELKTSGDEIYQIRKYEIWIHLFHCPERGGDTRRSRTLGTATPAGTRYWKAVLRSLS